MGECNGQRVAGAQKGSREGPETKRRAKMKLKSNEKYISGNWQGSKREKCEIHVMRTCACFPAHPHHANPKPKKHIA